MHQEQAYLPGFQGSPADLRVWRLLSVKRGLELGLDLLQPAPLLQGKRVPVCLRPSSPSVLSLGQSPAEDGPVAAPVGRQ